METYLQRFNPPDGFGVVPAVDATRLLVVVDGVLTVVVNFGDDVVASVDDVRCLAGNLIVVLAVVSGL